MAYPSARTSGTVARWNDERGFGFVTLADGSGEVFLHVSGLEPGSLRPRVGETLTFTTEVQNGKVRAVNARVGGIKRPRMSRAVLIDGIVNYVAVAAFLALFFSVNYSWPIPLWVTLLYGIASILAILSYWADKAAARHGRRRVPEASLLGLGLIGGWPGAIMAQQLLRHKTRKVLFRSIFWLTVLVNVVLFVALTTPAIAWITDSVLELVRG